MHTLGRKPPTRSPIISRRTDAVGALYVLTNSPIQNAVAVWRRDASGRLTPAGFVSTGGSGTGDFLDAQGSLVLSEDKERLFAVNALSNEISVFAVDNNGGITLIDKVPSGGERPNSLTVRGKLLYVLNSGGSGNVTAFQISSSGKLIQIPGSTSNLSTTETLPCPRGGDAGRVCSAAGPAQIEFNPEGNLIVVTERLTSRVLSYKVEGDGRATLEDVFQADPGSAPFGFEFAPRGRLIVSNNFLDAAGLGAASSYLVHSNGDLQQVTGLLANHQTSSCWVVVTSDGQFAITANPMTSSLTTYGINQDGSISIANLVAAEIVNGDPHDMNLSRDGQFLFVLNGRHATVSSFRVGEEGTLTSLEQPAATGFPAFAVGMAAR